MKEFALLRHLKITDKSRTNLKEISLKRLINKKFSDEFIMLAKTLINKENLSRKQNT